jgi:hypothetical protein
MMTQSDENVEPVEESTPTEEAAPPAPVLNREQRRALARGGKTSTTGQKNAVMNHAGKASTHGAAGAPRFPRTGHK